MLDGIREANAIEVEPVVLLEVCSQLIPVLAQNDRELR